MQSKLYVFVRRTIIKENFNTFHPPLKVLLSKFPLRTLLFHSPGKRGFYVKIMYSKQSCFLRYSFQCFLNFINASFIFKQNLLLPFSLSNVQRATDCIHSSARMIYLLIKRIGKVKKCMENLLREKYEIECLENRWQEKDKEGGGAPKEQAHLLSVVWWSALRYYALAPEVPRSRSTLRVKTKSLPDENIGVTGVSRKT